MQLAWIKRPLLVIALMAQAVAWSADNVSQFLSETGQWLKAGLDDSQSKSKWPLRIEVQMGQLDPRVKLAACGRIEPYIPSGVAMWGNTKIGLKCADGSAQWNVFLPVTIKAFGAAWVLQRPVQMGQVLMADDAHFQEVDWMQEGAAVLTDSQQWVGRVASKNMNPGQALRLNSIKLAYAFQPGAQVRVVAQGGGFSVSSRGQAVTAGVVGQSARVKLDNGKIATGWVVDEKTIQLEI